MKLIKQEAMHGAGETHTKGYRLLWVGYNHNGAMSLKLIDDSWKNTLHMHKLFKGITLYLCV